jgi:hypothetical protein
MQTRSRTKKSKLKINYQDAATQTFDNSNLFNNDVKKAMKVFLDKLEDVSADFRFQSIPDPCWPYIYNLAAVVANDDSLNWYNQVNNSVSEEDTDLD